MVLNKEEYDNILDDETTILLKSLAVEESNITNELHALEDRLKKVKELKDKLSQGELRLSEAKK